MAAASVPGQGGPHVTETRKKICVNILDRSPVTGSEELVVATTLDVDPKITVEQCCDLVYQYLRKSYTDRHGVMQKFKDAVPRLGWQLFLPDILTRRERSTTYDVLGEYKLDAQTIQGQREFVTNTKQNDKAQYMDLSRQLWTYDIFNGIILHYKRRTRALPIAVFGGQVLHVQIDECMTVYEIVEEVAQRLKLGTPSIYSLKTHDDPAAPGNHWLRGHHTLPEQLVDLNDYWVEDDKARAEPLIFKQKIDDRHVGADFDTEMTPNAIYLKFGMCVQTVLDGSLPVVQREAVILAGLQLQATFGDHDPARHKKGFISNMRLFMPAAYIKERGVEQAIYERHALMRGKTVDESRRLYIKTCRSNRFYSWNFWEVNEEVWFGGRRTILPRIIGIGGTGIARLDPKTKKQLFHAEWREVKGYGGDKEVFIYETVDGTKCKSRLKDGVSGTMMIQYCLDYFNAIKAASEEKSDIREQTAAVTEEAPMPAQGVATLRAGVFAGGGLQRPAALMRNLQARSAADVAKVASTFAAGLHADELILPTPTPHSAGTSHDFPVQKPENERFEVVAGCRSDMLELEGAIQTVASDLLAATASKSKAAVAPPLAFAAMEGLKTYVQKLGDVVKEAAAASSDPEDAKQMRYAYRSVTRDTGNLVARAGLICQNVADNEDPTGSNLNDLLAAARALGRSITAMAGTTGLPALASDAQTTVLNSTMLAEPAAKSFSMELNANTSALQTALVRSRADAIIKTLESVPGQVSVLTAQVEMGAAGLRLPTVREDLTDRGKNLLKLLDNTMAEIPSTFPSLLAAASSLSEALRKVSSDLETVSRVPARQAERLADGAAELRNAVMAVADSTSASALDASARDAQTAASQILAWIKIEVDAVAEGGSHDSLMETARAVAEALNTLKNAVGSSGGNLTASKAAAAALLECVQTLLAERAHVQAIRELAAVAVMVTGKFDGFTDAPNSTHDVRRTVDRLVSACRLYSVAPADLSRQRDLLRASRLLINRASALLDARPNETQSAALASLQERVTAAEGVCWGIELHDAQLQLQGIATTLAKPAEPAAPQTGAGAAARREEEMAPIAYQDTLVQALEVLEPLLSKTSEVATSARATELAVTCRELATEAEAVNKAVVGLHLQTLPAGVPADGANNDLLAAAAALATALAELVKKSGDVMRRPSAAGEIPSLNERVQAAQVAYRRVWAAMPGVGDCNDGVSALAVVAESIDDAENTGSGLDLLAVARALASALAAVTKDSGGAVSAPELAPDVERQRPSEVFAAQIVSAGRLLVSASGRLAAAVRTDPAGLRNAARSVTNVTRALVDAATQGANSADLADDKFAVLGQARGVCETARAYLEAAAKASVDDENKADADLLKGATLRDAVTGLGACVTSGLKRGGSTAGLVRAARAIQDAVARLSLPLPAAEPLSVWQGAVAKATSALGGAAQRLRHKAETVPEETDAEADEFATSAVRLVNACLTTVGSVNDALYASSSAGENDDGLRQALKQTRKPLLALAKLITKHTEKDYDATTEALRNLVVMTQEFAGNIDAEATKTGHAAEWTKLTGALKLILVKVVKSVGGSMNAPDDETLANAATKTLKKLLSKLREIEEAAKELEARATDDAIPASALEMQKSLLAQCRSTMDRAKDMLGTTKVLVTDTAEIAHHSAIARALEEMEKSLSGLTRMAKMLVPGQREFAAALAGILKTTTELNQAAIDCSVQQLSVPSAVASASTYMSALGVVCASMKETVDALESGTKVGPLEASTAAVKLAGLMPELSEAVRSLAAVEADATFGLEALRAAAWTAQVAGPLVQSCQLVHDNPEQVPIQMESFCDSLNKLSALVEGHSDLQSACEQAIASIDLNAKCLVLENALERSMPAGTTIPSVLVSVRSTVKELIGHINELLLAPQRNFGKCARAVSVDLGRLLSTMGLLVAISRDPFRSAVQTNGASLAAAIRGLIVAAQTADGSGTLRNDPHAQAVSNTLVGLNGVFDAANTLNSTTSATLAQLVKAIQGLNNYEVMNASTPQIGHNFGDLASFIVDVNRAAEKIRGTIVGKSVRADPTELGEAVVALLTLVQDAFGSLHSEEMDLLLGSTRNLALTVERVLSLDSASTDEIIAAVDALEVTCSQAGATRTRIGDVVESVTAEVSLELATLSEAVAARASTAQAMQAAKDLQRSVLALTQLVKRRPAPQLLIKALSDMAPPACTYVEVMRAVECTPEQRAEAVPAVQAAIEGVVALLKSAAGNDQEEMARLQASISNKAAQSVAALFHSHAPNETATQQLADESNAAHGLLTDASAELKDIVVRQTSLTPGVANMVTASAGVIDACDVMITVGVVACADAKAEEATVAVRGLTAAASELVNCTVGYLAGRVDAPMVEAASRAIASAFLQVAEAVMNAGDAQNPAQKAVRKAAKAGGVVCRELIAALGQMGSIGEDDDGDAVEADGADLLTGGVGARGTTDRQDELERRAKILQLEKQLQ